MSDLILSCDELSVEIDSRTWLTSLDHARRVGWTPAGTQIDGAGPYWCGEYRRDGYHGVFITQDDAAALAVALTEAVEEPTPQLAADPVIDELIAVCSAGEVWLSGSDVRDYCSCELLRTESLANDHLDEARTSPWVPRPDFDSYLVFGAVRAQVHERCWARHLETREALAQAICGHLDRWPRDIFLSDPELLGMVQRSFYPSVTPRDPYERRDWDVRADGAYLMLRNAKERLVREQHPPTPRMPILASQGPWWRAARLLRDHDVALIAGGVEWLYQRGFATSGELPTFGPGEDPPVAAIPKLDLDQVQEDIFGLDPEHWPGQCLAAFEEPGIRDAADWG